MSSPGCPEDRLGRRVRLERGGRDGNGRLERSQRRARDLAERRRDGRAERNGELDRRARRSRASDRPGTAARGRPRVSPRPRRLRSSLPRRPRLNTVPFLAAKSGLLARLRCLNGFTSAPPFGCTSKCRCGLPFASPESPFQAICWPAVTCAPFGTANVTSLTQPPLLSFRGVRSLFRWM